MSVIFPISSAGFLSTTTSNHPLRTVPHSTMRRSTLSWRCPCSGEQQHEGTEREDHYHVLFPPLLYSFESALTCFSALFWPLATTHCLLFSTPQKELSEWDWPPNQCTHADWLLIGFGIRKVRSTSICFLPTRKYYSLHLLELSLTVSPRNRAVNQVCPSKNFCNKRPRLTPGS